MSTTTKTLKDATELYLTHLRAIGKKPSTIGTAKRTLNLLIDEMGEDKKIERIMPVHVSKFFKSEPATMLRGKPRAQASILQIRRIVRGALVWWHSEGLIAKIPLPADEKKFLEPKGEKKAKKKPAKPEPEPPADDEAKTEDAPLIIVERPGFTNEA